MTRPFPDYLKLHVEDDARDHVAVEPPGPVLERLFRCLESVTGWLFSLESKGDGRGGEAGIRALATRDGQLRLKQTANPPRCAADEMYDLGAAVAGLADQWHATQALLKRYEAELAATVPVVVAIDDGRHLATRLEAVLRGMVEGFGARAASVYLLNEATSELKLRAQWGLAEDRWTDPPRSLRGAVADLEALTGHAVVIEDSRLLPHWRVPEDEFLSAVCVPVSTPTVPLGTLWLFDSRPRDFTSQETNLVEIVAGRVAAELEREALVRDVRQLRRMSPSFRRPIANARREGFDPAPSGWEVAVSLGWPDRQRCDWIDYRVFHPGQICFGMGVAPPEADEESMAAGQARGVLMATLLQQPEPQLAIQRVNHLLSQTAGTPTVDLVAGVVDVDDGTLRLAVAGQAEAYILRPHGWEPVGEPSEPAGADDTTSYTECRNRMEPGDILCVLCQPATDPTSEYGPEIAELLLHNTHLNSQQLAELYDRQFASKWPSLVIKRLSAAEVATPGAFTAPDAR